VRDIFRQFIVQPQRTIKVLTSDLFTLLLALFPLTAVLGTLYLVGLSLRVDIPAQGLFLPWPVELFITLFLTIMSGIWVVIFPLFALAYGDCMTHGCNPDAGCHMIAGALRRLQPIRLNRSKSAN
jgi:hypothetical protein